MSVADQRTESTFVLSRFKKKKLQSKHTHVLSKSCTAVSQMGHAASGGNRCIEPFLPQVPKSGWLSWKHWHSHNHPRKNSEREASKQIIRVNISQSRAEHLKSFLAASLATGATSKSQINFSSTGNNMMGCSFLPSRPSALPGTLKLWPGLSQAAHSSNRWEISALTANYLSL